MLASSSTCLHPAVHVYIQCAYKGGNIRELTQNMDTWKKGTQILIKKNRKCKQNCIRIVWHKIKNMHLKDCVHGRRIYLILYIGMDQKNMQKIASAIYVFSATKFI